MKTLRIPEDAMAQIPEEALLQFLQGHGLEVVRTMHGDVARPVRPARDYPVDVGEVLDDLRFEEAG